MSKAIRAAAVLAASLGLSGCYESETMLLDEHAAAQPLASQGASCAGDVGENQTKAQLTAQPDGWYLWQCQNEDGSWEKGDRVLLNALGGRDGYRVYVLGAEDPGSSIYGLVEVSADGRWYSHLPSCDHSDEDRAGAAAAGAAMNKDTCDFTSREQLFAAMKAIMARDDFQKWMQR